MKTPAIRPDQTQKYFERLERERFYGVIEVHFENGCPAHLLRRL